MTVCVKERFLQQVVEQLSVEARTLVIKTPEHYVDAAEFVKRVKQLRSQVEEFWGPIVKAAHQSHQEAVAGRKRQLAPVEEAERVVKHAMVAYDNEMERARLAEQRRLEEAERQRRLEELKNAPPVDEQAAEDFLASGKAIVPARATPVPAVEKATPIVSGISMPKTWKFEITDENLIPRDYLVPDLVKIGQEVRRLKDRTAIPGIRAYQEKTAAIR